MNVPLYPYTSDDVYLWAFEEVVPPLLASFRPDVLVTQLGIDSHYKDPITHLALTVQGFSRAVQGFSQLAPAKWLALGGGGYDLHAVARAWTAAYGVMIGQEFPDEIPGSYRTKHGVSTLSDTDVPLFAEQVAGETRTFAESSVSAVHRLVYPAYGISLA